MNTTETTIGRAIRAARLRRKLTQVELGARAGLSSNSLAMIERDEQQPTWATVCAVADALGVNVAKLRG